MTLRRTEFEEELVSRIARDGPLTFRDFMKSALYDPEHGYYNTERLKIGPAGDYYTSSNVHSAFGAVLARVFIDLVAEVGEAGERFSILEAGAGTGQLAFDILQEIRDEHREAYDRLIYNIVETSPVMRRRQQEKLACFGDRVQWRKADDLLASPPVRIVFSNELIDALPVHRVRLRSGCLEEQYVIAGNRVDSEPGSANRTESHGVGANEGRFTFIWREPSTPRLSEYLERSGVSLVEGQMAEVGLDAVDWITGVSRTIVKGFLVTIDYGDLAAHLYGLDRRDGTLRSFYRHRLIDSPLERVGEQDITASVSFTALIEYGRDCGLETRSFERQAAFLLRNGLIDRITKMEIGSGVVDDLKERLAVKNLFVPGGVSDNFRVLIQSKNAEWSRRDSPQSRKDTKPHEGP